MAQESASPLQLNDISKTFAGKKVLDSINLKLDSGEIFGLIGLNGAGKTTMIKIILGLLGADSGDASIFDQDIKKPIARKKLCYLPEKFIPSIYLKGYEFVELTTAYHSAKPSREKIVEKAASLGLEKGAVSSRVGKYSKGMGQKIGLIATLLSEAPLLVLDEPMSGLDPKARILLKKELMDYRNSGKTVFFSSHILADLEEICDRIAVLHDTKIIFVGSPSDFINQNNAGGNLERAFLNATHIAN